MLTRSRGVTSSSTEFFSTNKLTLHKSLSLSHFCIRQVAKTVQKINMKINVRLQNARLFSIININYKILKTNLILPYHGAHSSHDGESLMGFKCIQCKGSFKKYIPNTLIDIKQDKYKRKTLHMFYGVFLLQTKWIKVKDKTFYVLI